MMCLDTPRCRYGVGQSRSYPKDQLSRCSADVSAKSKLTSGHKILIAEGRGCRCPNNDKSDLRCLMARVACCLQISEALREFRNVFRFCRFVKREKRFLDRSNIFYGYVHIKHCRLIERILNLRELIIHELPVLVSAGVPKLDMAQLHQSHDVAKAAVIGVICCSGSSGRRRGEWHFIAKHGHYSDNRENNSQWETHDNPFPAPIIDPYSSGDRQKRQFDGPLFVMTEPLQDGTCHDLNQ